MLEATGLPKDNFCTSHFNGIYPISIGKREHEIKHLKPGQTLPKSSHTPTKLAATRTASV
jgi:hypothetical protein